MDLKIHSFIKYNLLKIFENQVLKNYFELKVNYVTIKNEFLRYYFLFLNVTIF